MPRILITASAIVTMVGAFMADVAVPESAAQHIFNDSWPPHAKFHDAQYIVMAILLGALSAFFVARRQGNAKMNVRTAAVVAAIPWLGMFGALLFPGTALHDPEFPTQPLIGGLHAQLVIAMSVLAVLAAAVIIDSLSRRSAPHRDGDGDRRNANAAIRSS